MKEIGGYFGLEQLVSNEYYKDLIPLNSGRNALLYILKAKKISKLYIPCYLCDSVSNMMEQNGYDYEYYNIDSQFQPIFDKKLLRDEYLYIVNYYGQLNNECVKQFKKTYTNIIIDNTQAFFQKPIEEVDTIYSCRKFFGVPDGAYLFTNFKITEELNTDISKGRMKHLLGRYEINAKKYYSDFQNVNKTFINEPLKNMSKLTHNILGAIDYEKICKIRNENFAYIEKSIGCVNKLSLSTPVGAFCYPFYIEKGIEIRKELAKQSIYIPTLWPNVLEKMNKDSVEYRFAANILPLPCDQRYGLGDISIVIGLIMKYINLDNLHKVE